MEHNPKKRNRLKKMYELETYNNDDNSNDESLLAEDDDKEKIFINNESIKENNYNFKKNKNKNKKEKLNILKNNNNEDNKEKKSFNYIVKIDKNNHKNINDNRQFNNIKEKIPTNSISTSKYTYYNFLPKILFEQFSKIANIYFLIIAFFQVFKEISNSNGKPVILIPLFIVVSINGVKDFYEDWKRKKSDDKENSKNCLIYNFKKQNFIKKKWKDVLIGDIIKVKEDEYFPADSILLATSEESNCCYIETKSIDGETNLKFKKTNKKALDILNNSKDKENLINFHSSIIYCQQPNEFIYEFNGKFIGPNNQEFFLDIDNFILRGCSLKQTSYIYAVVVYVGHDTKIMKNSVSAKEKVSKIEHITNNQILIVFVLQFIIGIVSSLIGNIQLYSDRKNLWYIYPLINEKYYINNKNNIPTYESDIQMSFGKFLITIGTWIMLVNNIVPISLLVTLEMVKYIQGIFISWDYHMYDLVNHQKPKVQTSTLNEELGQVKFIFSDKTGTLTKNYMEYKAMSINGKIYGINDREEKNLKKKKKIKNDEYGTITNFNFSCHEFKKDFVNCVNENDIQYKQIYLFLLCLSLCHSVITDQNSDPKIVYKSSSPDESAMVNCSRNFGIIFAGRDIYDNIFILEKNKTTGKYDKISYKLLSCLDYSSERKRMAVIIRFPDNKIYLFAKGADSAIGERVTQNKELIEITNEHLIEFANHGLRTLMVAYRELTEEEYIIYDKAYKLAMNNPEEKDKLLKEAYALVEKNYYLLGATAIEDKLQDNISNVLYNFIEAGIKIWVLTGDKMDTAKSIAYSCKLLDHSFIIFQFDNGNITFDNKSEMISKIRETLKDFIRQYLKQENEKDSNNKYGLIVSMTELNIILGNVELENIFYSLAIKCNTVLCCRVSPKQKAEMVNLVKHREPEVTTLAIGDGANDVNMITTASIGIGIMGVEGLQAARASDYCISEFQFLKRLLFVHGRESYRKNSFIVCYNFYKNFLFVLPQFWLGFYNYFSGQYLYDPYIYQLFNIIFTCFPIAWFGIYDKEVSYDILMEDSRYYTQGIINKLFHNKRFWKWVFYGILQAFFVFVYSFLTCEYINDGHLHDLTSQGSIAYSSIVLIANIKILTTTNSHTFISLVFFLFSILSYYLIVWLMSLYFKFFNFNNFKMIFTSWHFYLNTFFIIALCTIVDKGIDKFCRIFGIILDPLNIDIKQFELKESYKEMSIIRDEINKKKSKRKNTFTGSAFTYTYDNELKAAMDKRRMKMEKNHENN